MLDRERWFISRSVAIILLFILCLFALFARFCTGMERSSTNRSSFETKRAGDRVSIVVSRYLLLFIHWSNDSSFRQESRQRTFFFCKTKVLSFRGEEEAKFFCCKPTFLGRIFFVDDLDYDRGPEASFSERELIFVGKKIVARTRTEIDRSNGRPPLSKNYAFHQRTTNDLFFSFLAETC